MNLMEREQFDKICKMLKAQGKKVNKENIAMYLRQNKNQMNKLADNVKKKQEVFKLRQVAFFQNVLFRFKFFNFWVIVYKRGVRGKFYSLELIRSKND